MAVVTLALQFRFQKLRKGEEKGAKDRAPLFMKVLSSGSGRKAFPRTLPFIALSGLWSLGNQVFHLIQCFSEKNPAFSGKEEGEVVIGRQVAALATVCLSIVGNQERQRAEGQKAESARKAS